MTSYSPTDSDVLTCGHWFCIVGRVFDDGENAVRVGKLRVGGGRVKVRMGVGRGLESVVVAGRLAEIFETNSKLPYVIAISTRYMERIRKEYVCEYVERDRLTFRR